MAEFKITEWRGKQVADVATDVNIRAMEKAALLVERYVKKSFKVGTGRKYKRGGKVHSASVAGQPPAVDTGALRSSIGHEVFTRFGDVVGLVGDTMNVKYAPMLELGTHNMKPRPFLRPAVKKNRREINKIFNEANG
ncbi:MAG: hypothetical protein CMB80_02690 [Flammeovirgaceae bacterium]|nr:hypothetical protein [Flammeovirgaceae bacterium]|tara:strand:- start:560 stop:970 length:411 start_codon:yes stop_codon:yes gene_type:complete